MNKPIEITKVSFSSSGVRLEGLLSGVPEKGGAGVVVCHPHPVYGGEMRNLIVKRLSESYAGRSITALRFNFRGVGQSQGTHEDGRGEVADVAAAIDYMTHELGLATIHLAGYSFGASMMLKNAETDPRAASLVAVAPPVDFMPVSVGPVKGATPKLVFAGGQDEYCTLESLNGWYSGVADPKKLVMLDDADHFFGGKERELAEIAAAFAVECG